MNVGLLETVLVEITLPVNDGDLGVSCFSHCDRDLGSLLDL